jgi:hypothetical protein
MRRCDKLLSIVTPGASMKLLSSRRTASAALLAGAVLLATAAPALAVDLDLDFGRGIAGSGTAASEQRPVARFHGLKLATRARVEVRQGEVASVEVQADDNVLPLIATTVEDGTLTVEDRKDFRSRLARVVVVVDRLDALAASGSTAATVGKLAGPELSVAIGGSSAVSMGPLVVQRLKLSQGGSSVLKLAGSTTDFSINAGGSSTLDARKLDAVSVTLSAGGSSALAVRARDRLTVSAGGSAGVRYYGKPVTKVSTGGSSSVVSLPEEGS